MSTTSNMQITLATPGASDGTWGDTLNAGMNVVDAHDHTPGKGVPVPSSGVTVVEDLSMEGYSLISTEKVTLVDHGSGLSGASNRLSVNAANGDLYWSNGSGTAVQITDGTSLNAAAIANPLPVGGVMQYAGTSAPTGWFICNGAAVSRTTYADLFAVIGTLFGVGDGSTTFNIPDARGRVAVGVGSGSGLTTRALAATGGEENHLLSSAEMPSHTHTQNAHTHGVTDPGHTHGLSTSVSLSSGSGGAGGIINFSDQTVTSLSVNSATTGISIQNATATNNNTGGGGSHNNMQPFIGFNYIIRHQL